MDHREEKYRRIVTILAQYLFLPLLLDACYDASFASLNIDHATDQGPSAWTTSPDIDLLHIPGFPFRLNYFLLFMERITSLLFQQNKPKKKKMGHSLKSHHRRRPFHKRYCYFIKRN